MSAAAFVFLLGEQREPLPPGDQGDEAVDPGEEAQQGEAPAQGEGGAREDPAREDRHRGAVYLERSLAVEEELAERMVVIHVDQAEERRRAPLDEADVAPPQGFRVLPPLYGGDDRPP